MEHAFLLFVFLGIGEDKRLVSNDLYFRDLNDCKWYAKQLHEQGNLVTSYCLPKLVSNDIRVY